jgi:hypothetical protein
MADMMKDKGAMGNMPDRAMMERQMPDRAMMERQMPSREMMPTDMPPEELRALDSAITPEVARVLMKLLPELRQLIEQVAGGQQQQRMPEEGQMGALAGMR